MSEYKKPLPEILPHSKAFWEGTKENKLLIQHCDDCNSYIFYPRRDCPNCWSQNTSWKESQGVGELYSFSITYEGVEKVFAEDLPIVLAWVDLPEGVRLQTNIIDCDPDTVEIGMQVKVVYKKVTDEITLPYFTPVNT